MLPPVQIQWQVSDPVPRIHPRQPLRLPGFWLSCEVDAADRVALPDALEAPQRPLPRDGLLPDTHSHSPTRTQSHSHTVTQSLPVACSPTRTHRHFPTRTTHMPRADSSPLDRPRQGQAACTSGGRRCVSRDSLRVASVQATSARVAQRLTTGSDRERGRARGGGSADCFGGG